MRILVHDYAGHPFQVQLSRALARRGHDVLHTYCGSLPNTAHGIMHRLAEDPPAFDVEAVRLPETLDKYRYVRRWRQEVDYGRRLTGVVVRFRPDVVLSGNTPLDAQARLLAACRRRGTRFVFWVQDLLGEAAHRVLRRKLPLAGDLVGRYYVRLEGRLLRRSDAAVVITDDFVPLLTRRGVPADRLHVIENWAPLEKTPVRPKDNAWSRAHGLAGRRVLLYSGNLGMKHDPALLVRLARHFRDTPDVRVVVVSEGLGADWLREQQAAHGLDNLLLFGFQPFERLPDVLGAADVLLALLEPDAGVFSVPSKVLTYLCAARPVLLAVPPENLAARIVAREEAGRVVAPGDAGAFVAAAETLLADGDLRARLGRNARAYAERTFDLERITDAFERVLST
ncbi:glycosyltransferase family 4 protein [Rhodocaloribacter litoris]|uniref:glycosyltransferase family 4 protein n=1 Tax=Rhodocaloribacter litoris TaxID=2558931 RepID=UPI001422D559|nr:glycosyltransferase family 4 protein [Rhodocaloribacter litoris]QXD15886.1 glycosyltransferase family 4 protein [Rhodocaloribacter litoris]